MIPQICFPSASAILEYLSMFGILRGMDLPLGLDESFEASSRNVIKKVLNCLSFPFEDQRSFIQRIMRK